MPNDSIIFTYSTNKIESLFKYKDTLPDSVKSLESVQRKFTKLVSGQ